MPTATFQTPLVEKTIKAKYKVIQSMLNAKLSLYGHFSSATKSHSFSQPI